MGHIKYDVSLIDQTPNTSDVDIEIETEQKPNKSSKTVTNHLLPHRQFVFVSTFATQN